MASSHQIVDEAEEALIAAGGFDIYQRDGHDVRPVMSSSRPAADDRATTDLAADRGEPLYLIEMLERIGDVPDLRPPPQGLGADATVPIAIGEMLLAREGHWQVPVAARDRAYAAIARDGSLPMTPGYDPRDAAAVQAGRRGFSGDPGQADAERRRWRRSKLIKEAITTFPFKSEVDRSVALSLFLTACADGCSILRPLHAITAPAAGTGKSLLIDLASILVSGHDAPVISIESDARSSEKRLGSSLMAGVPMISFDNCNAPLDQRAVVPGGDAAADSNPHARAVGDAWTCRLRRWLPPPATI